MIIIPISIIIVVLIWCIYSMAFGVDWSVHKDMTISNTSTYGYGSFEDFKREFNKVDWKHKTTFLHSLFDNDNDNKYHASIIEFDGKGMVIKDPFSYMLVKMYANKAIKQISGKNLVNWNNLEVNKNDFQKKIESK